MARRKTDQYWVDSIRVISEANPKWGAGRIEEELWKDGSRDDHPHRATIGRELHRFRKLAERERAAYGEFHWPQSMEMGLVPWEASRVALDVLRFHHLTSRHPPTVQRVLWHWRLALATPETNIDYRQGLIMAATTPEGRVELPNLETELAFQPWLDEAHEYAWNRAFPNTPWPRWKSDGPQTLDEILASEAQGEE
jgi:hypothetical protein